MATIKSFTSLKQSKKFAEILPLESADMHYSKDFDGRWFVDLAEYTSVKIPKYVDKVEEHLLPCWSLASLLGVLPEGTRLLKSANILSVGDTKYHCDCPKGNIGVWFDNPIDACYEMVLKLNELNLL